MVDLLVVIAIYGNVRTAMTASLVQIHERLRQSIRGVLDPIIYNPIKKLLKTDGKKSAQVRKCQSKVVVLHVEGLAKVRERGNGPF